MDYKNDKNEFIAFVSAGLGETTNGMIDVCLERVAKDVNEDFLKSRAELYKEEAKNDGELIKSLKKLAVICNAEEMNCAECPVCKYCNTYIETARNNVDDNSLKMIDLFCGAGGLSLGFTQEGFITSLANDILEIPRSIWLT